MIMITNCKAFVSNIKKPKIYTFTRNQEFEINTMESIDTNTNDDSIMQSIYTMQSIDTTQSIGIIDYSDWISKYSINNKEFLNLIYRTFIIIIIGTLIMTPSMIYYRELLKYISENSQTGSTAMINSNFF